MEHREKYILIADSGSTKTDWRMAHGNLHGQVLTQGLNPYQQNEEEIRRIIADELIPGLLSSEVLQADATGPYVFDLFFYGAGCTPDMCGPMNTAIRSGFSGSRIILQQTETGSDLLGAARALFGNHEGIACILGTGSNSGYYNGQQIQENIPPLGFILGDEGSGASLGKQLVGNCLKKQFPESLCHAFTEACGMTTGEIIRRVYRAPLPNRFLAGFAPFLHQHREHPAIRKFLIGEFTRFFTRNVALYRRPDLTVSLIGSIAHCFREEVEEAASRCGFQIGEILRNPSERLLAYHVKRTISDN